MPFGKRLLWPAGAVLAIAVLAGTRPRWVEAFAATEPAPVVEQVAGDPKKPSKTLSEIERAILAVDEAYVRAYDSGDAEALAALFADDAEVVDEGGGRHRGKPAIERRFSEIFAEARGITLVIETDEIRQIAPDVVKETGRSLASPRSADPVESGFTALYIRKDGRWLLSDVREESIPSASPGGRLKELDWMVGDWLEERPDAEVRLHCERSEDGNYILRTIRVLAGGKLALTISQRIGWDPLAAQIRSWEFDSAGGFGEGRWSREGPRWSIKHTGVRADGTATSVTNLLTLERPDRIRWVSTERAFGDRSIPGLDGDVLVRIPPPPAPTPSPRSPR